MNAPRHKLSAAERKRKSRMKIFASMSEEELAGYKAAVFWSRMQKCTVYWKLITLNY